MRDWIWIGVLLCWMLGCGGEPVEPKFGRMDDPNWTCEPPDCVEIAPNSYASGPNVAGRLTGGPIPINRGEPAKRGFPLRELDPVCMEWLDQRCSHWRCDPRD